MEQLAAEIQKDKLDTLIEIDGGVTLDNCNALFDAGANVLVAGNTVFSSPNPNDTISQLLK